MTTSRSSVQKANAFHFFVYSNLFIAVCAALMVYQTGMLLLRTVPYFSIIAFVFFSTLCSYSFHWYLTPDIDLVSSRLHWLKNNRNTHIVLFLISLAGVAFYGFLLIEYWPWLLLSAFITFLYTAPKIPHPWLRALRKVALGKTIFLACVWTYVTTFLPVRLSDQLWGYEHNLFACSRFFLIYAICILFDYRDREYDRSIGIRSLITRMNDRSITILFYTSLVLFVVFTIWFTQYQSINNNIVIGILLAPGIIVGALYRYSTKNFSDMLYYFVLDGLMALSAVLLLALHVVYIYIPSIFAIVNNFLSLAIA